MATFMSYLNEGKIRNGKWVVKGCYLHLKPD
jgi:hypothetical protein